jgi:hypothetical protein
VKTVKYVTFYYSIKELNKDVPNERILKGSRVDFLKCFRNPLRKEGQHEKIYHYFTERNAITAKHGFG